MNPKLLVKDVMTEKVIFVSPEDEINKVSAILTENRIHGVPVMEDGKITGIITETDFFTKSFPNFFLPSYVDFLKNAQFVDSFGGENKKKVKEIISAKAKDIMTSPCLSVKPDTEINKVIDLMRVRQFATLPVENEKGGLVGIITVTDILKLI
jgi:CBS domain-containing protein